MIKPLMCALFHNDANGVLIATELCILVWQTIESVAPGAKQGNRKHAGALKDYGQFLYGHG
jgi:hypothetical protein